MVKDFLIQCPNVKMLQVNKLVNQALLGGYGHPEDPHKTAELQDIEEMHRHIRNVLIAKSATGNDIPILYGGSVKAENASNIFAVPQVGGALVGGASLNSQDFLEIIKAGQRND